MAGTHYSPRSSDAPRTVRRPRIATALSLGGTRTVGRVRLRPPSLRFSATSRCVETLATVLRTERRVLLSSGLPCGDDGCWLSPATQSLRTSASRVRSVATRSVGFSDSVLNAPQGCDDPAERAEQAPHSSTVVSRSVCAVSDEARDDERSDRATQDEREVSGGHSAESNRPAMMAVRHG